VRKDLLSAWKVATQLAHRVRRAPDDSAVIRNATKGEATTQREPRADCALGDPQGGPQHGCGGKDSTSARPTTSELRDNGGQNTQANHGSHAETDRNQRHNGRKYRESRHHPPGARELVIRLADALAPEVMCSWRETTHEQIRRRYDAAAGGLDGSNELEILEQNISIVARTLPTTTLPTARLAV
jgi:hypothetical protein